MWQPPTISAVKVTTLGSTGSQFEVNIWIFGGEQVSKDLDFRLQKWDFSVFWNIFGYLVALLNSAGELGNSNFEPRKGGFRRRPYDHIWSHTVIGSYTELGLEVAQDLRRLYSVLGGRVQGGAEKASIARPCLWGHPTALEECVFSD